MAGTVCTYMVVSEISCYDRVSLRYGPRPCDGYIGVGGGRTGSVSIVIVVIIIIVLVIGVGVGVVSVGGSGGNVMVGDARPGYGGKRLEVVQLSKDGGECA